MKHIFTIAFITLLQGFTASSSPLSPTTTGLGLFRLNLYGLRADNSAYLVDGTLTQYDSGFSNNLDGMDALKLFNPGENIGMVRGNYVLIGEKRHTMEGNDSIFFKMWNMQAITYQLVFIASNLDQPGRMGLLQDNYLHTSTALNLNDTTRVNFSVTSDPASKATDRFRVVFVTTSYSALPLTFTSISASEKDDYINLAWNTVNETNVKEYRVEKSIDDHNFITSQVIAAINLAVNDYHWNDFDQNPGNNFYRIASVDIDGKIQYSEIVRVFVKSQTTAIKVYPNPVTGNYINLQMKNQPSGVYEMKLFNLFGQPVLTQTVKHDLLQGSETIKLLNNIPKGIYQLQIKTPDGAVQQLSVLF